MTDDEKDQGSAALQGKAATAESAASEAKNAVDSDDTAEREAAKKTSTDDDVDKDEQPAAPIENSATVAVLHVAGLSDVVQSSALAQSVRLAWPEARIVLVTTQNGASLAQGLGFDEGIVFKGDGSKTGLAGIDRMVSRLRRAEVRALLVVSANMRSAVLAWRSKIFMRVTWAGRTQVPLGGMLERLAYTHKLATSAPGQNRADEIQQLLQPLHIPIAARFPRFRPVVAAKTWVTDFLQAQGIDKNKLVALVPASTKSAKMWPLAHWVQLINELVERNYQPLLVAGEQDSKLCDDMRAACQRSLAVRSAVGCNLEQSAELMRRALLTIGVDTGLSHLGLAAGAKGLLLFGPSLASRYALAGRARALRVAVDCRPCSFDDDGKCPVEGHACMQNIEPDRVFRQALKLMRKP